MLLLDADRHLTADPIPMLLSLARAQGLDVVAQFLDPRKYLNFGVSWTRASPHTSAVAQRLHNRSFRAWDQYLWNVEIGAAELACCQHKQLPIEKIKKLSLPKRLPESARGAHGEFLCEEPPGPSIGPPPNVKGLRLGPTSWNALNYNTLGWQGDRFATTCTKSCQFTRQDK